MDLYKNIDWSEVEKLKISSTSRIIKKKDLSHFHSDENITVQFSLTGDVSGTIDCYLCLDNKDVSEGNRNYLYPLFTESMNILIGKLISTDKVFSNAHIKLSPPKCTIYSKMIDSRLVEKLMMYELVINDFEFNVILNLNLTMAH
jgi:hypothetical protein